MDFKYEDENGEVITFFSTTIPGLMLIPPGKQLEDAKPIKRKEFEQRLKEVEKKSAVAPPPRNPLSEIDELKAELARLKADKPSNTPT